MRSKDILETLETQSVVFRKPADYERYVHIAKTNVSLVLCTLDDGKFTEQERMIIWAEGKNDPLPWVGSATVVFTDSIYLNFRTFLVFWTQLSDARKWPSQTPLLGEVVRALFTWCHQGGYRLYVVEDGKPLHMATPWDVEMASMHEQWDQNE